MSHAHPMTGMDPVAGAGPMSGAATPHSQLHERVDAFSRYAELATAQLAALNEADLEGFAQLAAARDVLAAEIDAGPDLSDLIADESGPGVSALIARARLALTDGAEAARAIERRLLELRDETRAAIAALEGRLPALRQYLETEGAGAGGLDIRL